MTADLLIVSAWLRNVGSRRTVSKALPRCQTGRGFGRPRGDAVSRRVLLLLVAVGVGLSASTSADAQDRTPAIELPPIEVRAEPAAEPTPAPVTIGGPPPEPCVEVDIAGNRAGHLECATHKLQQAGAVAQRQARSAIETPVLEAGSPDVTVGVASLPGSRLRMGNALGNSVHPQRPNRPPAAPRPGSRP